LQWPVPAKPTIPARVGGLPLRGVPSLGDTVSSSRGRTLGGGIEAIAEELIKIMSRIRERNLRARIKTEVRARLPEIEKNQTGAHLVVVRRLGTRSGR
jgi:hypothetical protein